MTDFGLLFAPVISLPDRPPLVVKMHGSVGQISEREPEKPASALDSALARVTEAALLPMADGLCAYSPINAAEWSARFDVPVDMIPPPMTLPPLQPKTLSDYSGLVAGRIQAWKGPHRLCEAVAAAGSHLPKDFVMAWAGRDTDTAPDGTSFSAWLDRHYPTIWGTRVVPKGQLAADTLASLQSSVRYVVVPSLWDTFNYVLAESMAAGAVTVGSQGAGAAFLLQDGVNGFTFDISNTQEFAAKLLTAHSLDAKARAEIGEAARATIDRQLNPGAIASATQCRSPS